MKIKEIIEKIDNFTESERLKYLKSLLKDFCDISKSTISQFLSSWDYSKSFEEFNKAQNEIIKECVKMELSVVGIDIRKIQGLKPFTENAEMEEY